MNLAQGQSEVYALASVFIPLTLFSLRHSVNRLIFFFPGLLLVLTLWIPFEQFLQPPTSLFSCCFLSLLQKEKLSPSCISLSQCPSCFCIVASLLFYSLARSSRGLIQRIPINIRRHETFMLSVYLCWGYFMCVCLYFKGCFLLM